MSHQATAKNTTFLVPRPPLFALGRVMTTPAALAAIQGSSTTATLLLQRHVTGDWFHMDDQERQSNFDAVCAADDEADRVFTSFKLDGGTTVFVITSWDRSVTTFVLESEYHVRPAASSWALKRNAHA